MKKLYSCLSWGLLVAFSTAYAMDQQLITQAEQSASNACWDDLVNLIDTHPEVSGDQWLSFLTTQVAALEKKDDAGYTFCSRLLFSACQASRRDQVTKKAVLEHLLSNLLGSNAQLNLTRTVSDEQISNLDLFRKSKPHREMYNRLVGRQWAQNLRVSVPLIGFVGVLVGAGVCFLAYFGYDRWKNQDVSGSDNVQMAEQVDGLITTTTVPIA